MLVAAVSCGGAGSGDAASLTLQRFRLEGRIATGLRVSKAQQQRRLQGEEELAGEVHAFPAAVMTSAAVGGLALPGGPHGWLLAGLANGVVQVSRHFLPGQWLLYWQPPEVCPFSLKTGS